jgi:hypothetical protein
VAFATRSILWLVCLTWCSPCFLTHPCEINEPSWFAFINNITYKDDHLIELWDKWKSLWFWYIRTLPTLLHCEWLNVLWNSWPMLWFHFVSHNFTWWLRKQWIKIRNNVTFLKSFRWYILLMMIVQFMTKHVNKNNHMIYYAKQLMLLHNMPCMTYDLYIIIKFHYMHQFL